MLRGAHSFRFGVRVREQGDDNLSTQNFLGTFIFGGGDLEPVLNAANQPVLDGSGQPLLAPISSIERYRRTLLGLGSALGGGPTQFSIAAGTPELALHQVDVGVFAADEWRARPNLTVSLRDPVRGADESARLARCGSASCRGVGAQRREERGAPQNRGASRIRHVLRPFRVGEHPCRGPLQWHKPAAVRDCESRFLPQRTVARVPRRGGGPAVYRGDQFVPARAVPDAVGHHRGAPVAREYHHRRHLHKRARPALVPLGRYQRSFARHLQPGGSRTAESSRSPARARCCRWNPPACTTRTSSSSM